MADEKDTDLDDAILAVGEMMEDPDVSEAQKTAAAMIAMGEMMDRHLKSGSSREFATRWETIQRPVMEALAFEGCTVEIYDLRNDGLSGAYLRFNALPYIVEIDAEDVETLEEIEDQGYLCITVVKLRLRDDARFLEDGEISDVLASDCVRNIEEAEQVCRLLQQGQEEEALGLIKKYDELFPKNRD